MGFYHLSLVLCLQQSNTITCTIYNFFVTLPASQPVHRDTIPGATTRCNDQVQKTTKTNYEYKCIFIVVLVYYEMYVKKIRDTMLQGKT